MADHEKEQGFKVVDKRRFDQEGNKKEQADQINSDVVDEVPSQDEPGFTTIDSASGGVQPEITFSSFIMSLATQTLVLLGELKPPSGVDIAVDKQAAKQTIDILQMLREKTRANLSKEEDDLFEEILHNLRLSFVKSGK